MISLYISRDMLTFNELKTLRYNLLHISVDLDGGHTSERKRIKAFGGRGIQSSGRFFECEDFLSMETSVGVVLEEGKSVDSGGTINSGGSL